jgi:hypothetical protein
MQHTPTILDNVDDSRPCTLATAVAIKGKFDKRAHDTTYDTGHDICQPEGNIEELSLETRNDLPARLREPNLNISIILTCQNSYVLTIHMYWFEAILIASLRQKYYRSFSEHPRNFRNGAGFVIKDASKLVMSQQTYTYYHCSSASRLVSFYLTKILHTRKFGMAVLPAAFTDHLLVEMRIGSADDVLSRRRYKWKIYPNIMNDPHLRHKIRKEWMRWNNCAPLYPDITVGGNNIWRNGYKYSSGEKLLGITRNSKWRKTIVTISYISYVLLSPMAGTLRPWINSKHTSCDACQPFG